MLHGKLIAQAVCAAAELGVADHVADAPVPAASLAAKCGANADALARLLRALASVGVFEERDGGFVHTPLSECLRSGAMRDVARMVGAEWHTIVETHTTQSIRSGHPAFEQVHGRTLFEHLTTDRAAGAVFDSAMTSLSAMVNPLIVACHDFSSAGVVVDVGGGHGALLLAVLSKYPNVRGVLFDRGPFADALPKAITTVEGSFFDSVPSGGDVYVLKHILHDWDDDKASTILRRCHEAMRPGTTLLVVEMIVSPGNSPSVAKLTDMEMLVVFGGRERTTAEYRTLLEHAGFTFRGETPTPAGLSILLAMR